MAEQVRAAERNARRTADQLAAAEREAERDPRGAFPALYIEALKGARRWRRYLRSTLGYDVTCLGPVHPSRIPQTDDAWRRLQLGFRAYRLQLALHRAMLRAGYRAEEQGDDPIIAAVRAYFDVQRLAPWLVAVDMEFGVSGTLRRDATIAFAGWAATGISTRFRRLREGLGGGTTGEVRRALLEQLPDAVLEAFYDLDPSEDPGVVRTHAANILMGGGQRRRKRRAAYAAKRAPRYDPTQTSLKLLAAGWDLDVVDQVQRDKGGPPLAQVLAEADDRATVRPDQGRVPVPEQFAAREEASARDLQGDVELVEAVRELAARLGLSEREAQVSHLRTRGWPFREIADYLGVDDDTARQYLHRARGKLNRRM